MKTLIRGNTFPVKEQLKALGCKWNREESAWVAFTPEAAAKAQELVAAAPSGWVSAARETAPKAPGSPETPVPVTGAAPSDPIGSARVASSELSEPGRDKVAGRTPERVSSRPSASGVRWSDEQKAIFAEFAKGRRNVVVQALAGTGKTTTIKEAFSHAPEQRMLYAVFNKRNQVEASSKISDPRVEIRTLHSLGYMFIKQVWTNAKPDDEIENERAERATGKDVADEVKTQVRRLAGFAKNTTLEPNLEQVMDVADRFNVEAPGFEEPENGGWDTRKLAQAALRVLELSKERDPEGRISFDDMVWLPVAMNWVRAWYDLVAVDEAQDQSLPQLTMVRRAVKPDGRVIVVGDKNQAIYRFRGAAQDGMDMMKRELNAHELGLTTTYRCPKKVVALAQAIVPTYKAAEQAPEGIVETIVENMLIDVAKPGEAILSRLNSPLMSLCLQLLKRGTPARIEGRDLGKALAATVRKLKARSVPNFLEKLETWAGKQKNRFKNTKRYEQKCEEINDTAATLAAVAEGAASVAEIESRLGRLFQDSDKASGAAVVLSSVHKAKGNEWPVVYLLRRTFNRKRPISSPAPTAEEAQEERNIFYVALTRSMNKLVFAEEVRGPGKG